MIWGGQYPENKLALQSQQTVMGMGMDNNNNMVVT
jgi:hypothetical protein